MGTLKIVFYVVMAILGIGLLIAAGVIQIMNKPDNCTDSGDGDGTIPCPPYLNGPECAYLPEKFEDPTIPRPSPLIYQSNFTFLSEAGPPYCAPVWYAFRYVKNKNGAYGPLSNWSGTKKDGGTPTPIYSGNVDPPCPPTGCEFLTGSNSCAFNLPKLEIFGKLDVDIYGVPPEESYTLNVHRQVGTGIDTKTGEPLGFDPTSEGEIVGVFTVVKPRPFFTSFFFNPKTTNGLTCC